MLPHDDHNHDDYDIDEYDLDDEYDDVCAVYDNCDDKNENDGYNEDDFGQHDNSGTTRCQLFAFKT